MITKVGMVQYKLLWWCEIGDLFLEGVEEIDDGVYELSMGS